MTTTTTTMTMMMEEMTFHFHKMALEKFVFFTDYALKGYYQSIVYFLVLFLVIICHPWKKKFTEFLPYSSLFASMLHFTGPIIPNIINLLNLIMINHFIVV